MFKQQATAIEKTKLALKTNLQNTSFTLCSYDKLFRAKSERKSVVAHKKHVIVLRVSAMWIPTQFYEYHRVYNSRPHFVSNICHFSNKTQLALSDSCKFVLLSSH